MDKKTVIFHLSSNYIDDFTKKYILDNKYTEPFILTSKLPQKYKKLNLKTINNYLGYTFISYNYNDYNPITYLLNLENIDIIIIYDVYYINGLCDNKENYTPRPIIEEFPELSDAYEIYFIDKDNILMYNHSVYINDILQFNNDDIEVRTDLIINRFILTAGIPTGSTKSARQASSLNRIN